MTHIHYFFILNYIDDNLKNCSIIQDDGYFQTNEEAIKEFKKRNKIEKKHGYSVVKEVDYYV